MVIVEGENGRAHGRRRINSSRKKQSLEEVDRNVEVLIGEGEDGQDLVEEFECVLAAAAGGAEWKSEPRYLGCYKEKRLCA